MFLKEEGTKQILNHMKVLRDKENILEKDVENKIESEVATDFSEASTPEFQQTIDDIKSKLEQICIDVDEEGYVVQIIEEGE